jgi:gluconolactonase
MFDGENGLADGMKVNKEGTIFATGPGGVLVFSPEGKHLGTIKTGQSTANCAFNDDESILFMTAHNYLMRINLTENE